MESKGGASYCALCRRAGTQQKTNHEATRKSRKATKTPESAEVTFEIFDAFVVYYGHPVQLVRGARAGEFEHLVIRRIERVAAAAREDECVRR